MDRCEILHAIEQPEFLHGKWIIREGEFPHFDYTSEIHDFIEALYANGFIKSFNWMNWEEGKQLVDNPMLLSRANLQTLRKLLTAHVRADRFSEGHLAATFESGHIVMILKRMAEIHNLMPLR